MPTPEPSPKLSERYASPSRAQRGNRRIYPRVNSDNSLSTISEEPTQYSSHEIVVQPEVIVETMTLPGSCHDESHHIQQQQQHHHQRPFNGSGNGGAAPSASNVYINNSRHVSFLLLLFFMFVQRNCRMLLA